MLVPYLNAMSQPKTDFESDCYVDAAPYLYQDKGKTFAVVKRSYRNVDLRKQVIGLTIIDTSNLMPLDIHGQCGIVLSQYTMAQSL